MDHSAHGMGRSEREQHLEAMRGCAALCVVTYHSLLGFLPQRVLPSPMTSGFTLIGTPAWGVLNGPAAVVFFFLLSGYVLTRRAVLARDPRPLVVGAVRRWPRLAGPVVVAVLFAYLFLIAGLDWKVEASAMTGSQWILGGGTANGLRPDVWKAISEGAALTFFRGDQTYNASLWTMHIEMAGSFVAYGLALALVGLPRRGPIPLYCLGVAGVLCHYANPFYVPFVAGVAYAVYRPRVRVLALGAVLPWAFAAAAIYLAGYVRNAGGVHAPIDAILPSSVPVPYVHLAAAALGFMAIEGSSTAMRLLSGKAGRFMGRISFPLYLIHTVVLCSAGAVTALALKDLGEVPAGLAACAVTIWLSIVVAVPLAAFNDRWVAVVNAVADRAMLQGAGRIDAAQPQCGLFENGGGRLT